MTLRTFDCDKLWDAFIRTAGVEIDRGISLRASSKEIAERAVDRLRSSFEIGPELANRLVCEFVRLTYREALEILMSGTTRKTADCHQIGTLRAAGLKFYDEF